MAVKITGAFNKDLLQLKIVVYTCKNWDDQ